MTCFMCKGKLMEGVSSFTVDIGSCIIIVKNVPSAICGQCGEVSYRDDVALRLEQLIDTIKRMVVTEVAIINYSEETAA